jgi:glycogen debranching enzyme
MCHAVKVHRYAHRFDRGTWSPVAATGADRLARRLAVGLLDAATAFGGRLPELFCGFPRPAFSPSVPYPTSCSPQAWASAAPLLLRSFLGVPPHVPHRTLTLHPALPPDWATSHCATFG